MPRVPILRSERGVSPAPAPGEAETGAQVFEGEAFSEGSSKSFEHRVKRPRRPDYQLLD